MRRFARSDAAHDEARLYHLPSMLDVICLRDEATPDDMARHFISSAIERYFVILRHITCIFARCFIILPLLLAAHAVDVPR